MRLNYMSVQPGCLIRTLHRRSEAEFASAVDGAGITQIQLSILLATAGSPVTDATRTCERTGSDRATVGPALERRKPVRRWARAIASGIDRST